MATHFGWIRRLAFGLFVASALVFSTGSLATNVQFVGSVAYSYVGNTAVLTANRVENFTSGGTSGTLHMELWAFPAPYNGTAQTGYKLAVHSLGQLPGGFAFTGISSGTIAFTYPPNGTWALAMILSEFDNGPFNGGFSVRDYVNFSSPLVVGPPASGQLSLTPSVNFGNVTVGTSSVAMPIVVTNIGGTTVTITSVTLTNSVDFVGTHNCSALAPGASCNGTVTFLPHTTGTLTGNVVVTSNGVGSPQFIPLSGVGVTGAGTALAIEYYHAAFDHYFVTAIADEIMKLDNGTFVGWARTNQSFKVNPNPQALLAAVCRFFSTSFAPKSSHFYTPDAPECLIVKANPNWLFEAVVFYMTKADTAGNCPAGTQPVYRLYNNGQGFAPNHRYTTSLVVRAQMIGQGWIPEGYGPIGVIMCAPL